MLQLNRDMNTPCRHAPLWGLAACQRTRTPPTPRWKRSRSCRRRPPPGSAPPGSRQQKQNWALQPERRETQKYIQYYICFTAPSISKCFLPPAELTIEPGSGVFCPQLRVSGNNRFATQEVKRCPRVELSVWGKGRVEKIISDVWKSSKC